MLLIIDGSNLAHRSYQKFKNLKSKDGKGSGMIYGFTRLLYQYVNRFQPTYVLVTFDSKKSKESNFRNKLIKEYKAHRKKLNLHFDYEEFNRQARVVRKILRYLNIPVLWDNKGLKHEADDYIAYFTKNHPGKVVIVSSDKDFGQLIDDRVKLFSPNKETIVRAENCKEVYGYEVNECVDFLCLVGDRSDDIPGYMGIGEVKARKFLDTFGTIEAFLSDPSAEFKGIDRDGLKVLYKRNRKLIDLNYALKKFPIKKTPLLLNKKGKILLKELYSLLESYTIRSFHTQEFLEPFKKLKQWEKGL